MELRNIINILNGISASVGQRRRRFRVGQPASSPLPLSRLRPVGGGGGAGAVRVCDLNPCGDCAVGREFVVVGVPREWAVPAAVAGGGVLEPAAAQEFRQVRPGLGGGPGDLPEVPELRGAALRGLRGADGQPRLPAGLFAGLQGALQGGRAELPHRDPRQRAGRYGCHHAGFPYLWVNGEKYSFSQEVLDHGSRLMIEFFKLEHTLRDFYGRLSQEGAAAALEAGVAEVRENLLEFDGSWSTFERLYVLELMGIEVQARSLIARAIEAEKCLTSVEIREKMKGKILINCEDYLSTRAKLCEIISQINQIANYCGKGRDDLDHSILLETEGILRRITRDQSKAIRILGEKIRGSFTALRGLLRKYDKNIEMVDPQLKNNSDLVEALVEYERSWEKGGNYFCDSEKKRHLLHFSGTIEGISEKYERFKEMVECSDADVFLIIPCILTLKSLDRDDKNLCKYFLPNLHQIDTKTFRLYFDLEKQFEEWKRAAQEHYCYYNVLEKLIVGVELAPLEQLKLQAHRELVDKILGKLKNIANELHRYNPNEWNSFMEICLAGSIGE